MALGKNMKIDRLIPLNIEDDKIQIEEGVSTVKEAVNNDAVISDPVIESVAIKEEVITPILEPVIDAVEDDKILFQDIEIENLKIVFTPSRRKTQKRILITIEGSLTINNVELLFSKVKDVFEKYDFVEITLNNITEIDLTVIQLFHATRVCYFSLKKVIAINADFSRNDRKLLNSCGFTEFQTQKVAEA